VALLQLGELGEPGGLVDRVADHRVLETCLGADVACDGASRRNADAELHVEAQHGEQFVVQLSGSRQCGP
jgi:hypothetical protein